MNLHPDVSLRRTFTQAFIMFAILPSVMFASIVTTASIDQRIATSNRTALDRSSVPEIDPVAASYAQTTPARLCIMTPTVKKGTLSGEAFVDRLLGLLQTHPGQVKAAVLEDSTDPATQKSRAASEGCQLIMFLTIAGDAPSFRLPFGAKYKVEVQYRIEDVGGSATATDQTAAESGKNSETVLRNVLDKIVAATLARAATAPAVSTNPTVATPTAPLPGAASGIFDPKSRPRLVVQTSHTSMVTDFVYSPNGKLLATLAADGVVKLWLVDKGKEIISVPGYQVVGLAFHPDSRSIACLSKNGVLRIFDVSTGRVLHRLTPIKGGGGNLFGIPSVPGLGKKGEDITPFFNLPSPVAFSATGKVLVSGGNGGVKVWDISKSSVLYQMANKEFIPLVALSTDGSLVAGVTEGYRIKLWSTSTGKETRTINTDIAALSALTFSANGQLIACGNINGTLKVYNTADGKEVKKLIDGPGEEDFIAIGRKVGRIPIVGDIGDAFSNLIESGDQLRNLIFKNKSIRALAFHPDSSALAYQAGDNIIHVLQMSDGKEILSVVQDGPAVKTGVTAALTNDSASPYFRQLCPIRYSTDGSSINGCKNFVRVQRWDSKDGHELSTLAVAKRGSVKGQNVPIPFPLTTVPRFANEKLLLTASFAGGVKLWDLEKRSTPQRVVETSPALGNNLPVSPDGKLLMLVSPGEKTLTIRGLNSQQDLRTFTVDDPKTQKIIAAQFSPDSKMVTIETFEEKVRLKFFLSRKVQLRVMDITSGQKLFDASDILENQFAFSPDAKRFAYMPKGQSIWDAFRNKTELRVYQVGAAGAWSQMFEKDVEKEFDSNYISKIVFSSDSKLMASEDKDSIKVWDADTGKLLHEHKMDLGTDISSFAFVPQRSVLTYTIFNRIYTWDLKSNQKQKLRIETDLWGTLAYSPNGRTIALGSVEDKVRLFDVETQDEIGDLVAPNEDDWMLTTPEGRFDTSRLDEIEEVHWVMPNEPFNPEAVEVFMRYYYEPRLLTRLLSGDGFAPVPELVKMNRAQPSVKVRSVIPAGSDAVRVTVEVSSTASETQTDAQGRPLMSGVYDVRLFRDGQLAGYSTSTKNLAALAEAPDVPGPLGNIDAWRQANLVKLDASGRATLVFDNVKIPHRAAASQLTFSAYAFNEDRVKSLTDRFAYALPPAAQPRKGRAYIIAVGVDSFENSSFDLEFAVNDAQSMQAALSQRLAATGQFSEIVPVTMTSTKKTPAARLATKANLRRVLLRLNNNNELASAEAGPPAKTAPAVTPAPTPVPAAKGRRRQPATTPAKPAAAPTSPIASPAGGGIPNFEKLRPATPDDLVLVLYSSHGYADPAGNFYFIPSDTGPGTEKVFDDTVRQRSISSNELALWLRDVDAGEMVLIVDACNSTAAIEDTAFKPAPMGSRGLGQLSYDKGMRILTATQADNVALESKSIRHGFLTYSLVVDGLEGKRADFMPQNNVITLLEWLTYGEDRVPLLFSEVQDGTIAQTPGSGARILVQSGSGGGGAPKERGKVQQPALFNFARRSSDFNLVQSP